MVGDGSRAMDLKLKKRKLAVSEKSQLLSPSAMLDRVPFLEGKVGNHACVHIYVPYSRLTGSDSNRFIEAMPTFSGWRAAWLLFRSVTTHGTKPRTALLCDVRWYNQTSQTAFITSTGDLLLSFSCEDNLQFPTDSKTTRMQVPVSVSHRLFKEEVESSCRGKVHGEVRAANNLRRVSHIVSRTSADTLACAWLPSSSSETVETVQVSEMECTKFVPELFQEFHWRNRRYLREEDVKAMLPFVSAFFEKAYANDRAVRSAMRFARTGELVEKPAQIPVPSSGAEAVQESSAKGNSDKEDPLAALEQLSGSLQYLADRKAKADAGQLTADGIAEPSPEDISADGVGFPQPGALTPFQKVSGGS